MAPEELPFNRTTVECKDEIVRYFFPHMMAFNRTTVECKSFAFDGQHDPYSL